MELAAEIGRAQPSRLIMAAISAVFTIGYIATLLGEDETILRSHVEDLSDWRDALTETEWPT